MEPRQITPRYFVSPQIDAEDLVAAANSGFTTVICNRPNAEVPPTHQSDVIRDAAIAAGLDFQVLELTHQTMTPENIARQRDMIAASKGPVLAYCASGTRCSVIWALGQADTMPADDILAITTNAGYDLSGLRPRLKDMSGN
ncbi:MAG: TIGR01244 family phosphatase [Rhodobacteraceae bacterium]|nr:TIGR01244 family phosphatase [Paracoccaceae bacterium]